MKIEEAKEVREMEECKLSNKIPMPEMVSIPKSEYELLIEIKDCFIGGNE